MEFDKIEVGTEPQYINLYGAIQFTYYMCLGEFGIDHFSTGESPSH